MDTTSNLDIFVRSNGRAAMLIFWAAVGAYTYAKYFSY